MGQGPPAVRMAMVESVTLWEGPLPAPDALKAYNGVLPRGAERIFEMARDEQRNRHRGQRRREWMLFSVVMGVLAVAGVEAWTGQAVWSLASLVAAVGGLAGVYLWGQQARGDGDEDEERSGPSERRG